MDKNVKDATAIFLKLETAYRKFRKTAGEVAQEYHMNPYKIFIKFLEVSLEEEKSRYKEARRTVKEDIPSIIQEIAGDKDELDGDDIEAIIKRLEEEED